MEKAKYIEVRGMREREREKKIKKIRHSRRYETEGKIKSSKKKERIIVKINYFM